MNALYSLFNHKSQLGLFGNHIDIDSGRWTAQDAGIGSGVDSYFEYLVKGSILLQRPELMEMFHEARKAIDKYMKKDDWYMWVSMTKGQVTLPVFQSLESYWPGVLSLIGGYKIYCSTKCEEKDQKNKRNEENNLKEIRKLKNDIIQRDELMNKLGYEKEDKLNELQKKIHVLEREMKEKDAAYKREKRKTLDFEHDVIETDQKRPKSHK
ncbi:hypothetical protein JTB14_009808 [Gonioctena quinquepunctata]|nr:hypothetical protein JTB14_009808 [Gonioctena quinquepunctata]